MPTRAPDILSMQALRGGRVQHSEQPRYANNKILEECSASLEVCHQRHPSVAINDAVICAEGEALALQERIEGELQLAAEQFDWETVEAVGWGSKGNYREMTALAALAGLP